MFDSLDLFRTADAMARHAGARQAVVARNMANADTPGYRARRIAPFAEAVETGQPLRATRAGHSPGTIAPGRPRPAIEEAAPNGNSVSLEREMLAGIEAEREHSRALAIYRHGLTVLRTALGRA